jgi:hypothetical protein
VIDSGTTLGSTKLATSLRKHGELEACQRSTSTSYKIQDRREKTRQWRMESWSLRSHAVFLERGRGRPLVYRIKKDQSLMRSRTVMPEGIIGRTCS